MAREGGRVVEQLRASLGVLGWEVEVNSVMQGSLTKLLWLLCSVCLLCSVVC